MDTIWKVRPFAAPAFSRPVGSGATAVPQVGDIAVLQRSDEANDEVKARIEAFETGRIRGIIVGTSRPQTNGDLRFASGLSILFEERHVFRIERAL